MNHNNFLLAFALAIGLQFAVNAAETQSKPSFLQTWTPQFMQDAATSTYNYAASWIPQSVKDIVNTWSTRKKVFIASAIIGSLVAAGYHKDKIMALLFDNTTDNNRISSRAPEEATFTGTPEEYAQMLEDNKKRMFEYEVKEIMDSLSNTKNTGIISATHGQLRDLYIYLNPNASQNPAFNEAVKRLEENQGIDFSR